jgi:hypothetical protein
MDYGVTVDYVGGFVVILASYGCGVMGAVFAQIRVYR